MADANIEAVGHMKQSDAIPMAHTPECTPSGPPQQLLIWPPSLLLKPESSIYPLLETKSSLLTKVSLPVRGQKKPAQRPALAINRVNLGPTAIGDSTDSLPPPGAETWSRPCIPAMATYASPLSTQSQRDGLRRRPLDETTGNEAGSQPRSPPTSNGGPPERFVTSSPYDTWDDLPVDQTPGVSVIHPEPTSNGRTQNGRTRRSGGTKAVPGSGAPSTRRGGGQSARKSSQESEDDSQPAGHTTPKKWRKVDKATGISPGRLQPQPRRNLAGDLAGGKPGTTWTRWLAVVVLIILVPFVIFACLCGSPNTLAQTHSLERLTAEMDHLHQAFPNQKRILRLFEVSIKDVIEVGRQPAVLLLGADPSNWAALDCLGRKLGESAKKMLRGSSELKERGPYDFADRAQLQAGLQQDLSTSPVAILAHLEKLSGSKAMALHALCDSDNAPYKQAFILLTVGVPEMEANAFADATIEGVLKTAWMPDLGEDKFAPIYSRISSYVALVQSEPNSQRCD